MTAQPITGEAMLSQHAMHLKLPIKEPAEAKINRRGRVETSLVP